jgi:hypothetical protein
MAVQIGGSVRAGKTRPGYVLLRQRRRGSRGRETAAAPQGAACDAEAGPLAELSSVRMLDTYMRMLGEFRRVMDSRKRGFNRFDYLLTLDELHRIAHAHAHPSNRP